ncbi:MAG TPA: hypothetical protein VGX48_00380 [Pyrinomonadaceae bacterium]|jgi:hypothetical protein|nr:hypothetical protein [Pyrinomonadaceae bacterium]
MTNQEHNKYVGLALLAYGGLQLLMTLVMTLFLFFFFSAMPGGPGDAPPPAFFVIVIGFMFAFQLFFTAPSLIAAYAVLKRKSWARVAAIVAGIMASISFPLGTAVAVYALWFMMGEGWKEIYDPASARPRGSLPYGREYAPWQEQTRRPEREHAPPPTPPDWR